MGETKSNVPSAVAQDMSNVTAQVETPSTVRAVPAWCHYVPAEYRSVACRGSSGAGCTCRAFCQDTPSVSWSNNPECCGCGAEHPALENASSAASTGGKGFSDGSAAKAVPAWCQFVPAEYQSVACRGSSGVGCTCQGFCVDTPPASWSNNPECCACTASRSTHANTTAADPATASVVAEQLAAMTVPAWCHFVPAQFQSAACRGSSGSGCTCKSFCESTARGSWSNNPECCGCSAPLTDVASTGSSGKAAAFLAPQQLSLKAVPAWCHFVPAEFQGVACRGSSGAGCTCKGFCQSTPRGSWSNNPECCGCHA